MSPSLQTKAHTGDISTTFERCNFCSEAFFYGQSLRFFFSLVLCASQVRHLVTDSNVAKILVILTRFRIRTSSHGSGDFFGVCACHANTVNICLRGGMHFVSLCASHDLSCARRTRNSSHAEVCTSHKAIYSHRIFCAQRR